MRSAVVAFSFLLVALLGVTQAAQVNEIEAKKFADQVSKKLFDFYDTIAEKAFSVDDEDFEALFSSVETIRLTSKELVNVVKDAREFDYTQFKDPELKEVFRTLSKSASLLILEEEFFTTVTQSLSSLKALASDKDIEPYRKDEDPLAYFPDVHNLIAKSNDPAELKYYWELWREKNSAWSGLHFYTLVQSIKNAANLTGVPVIEFWGQFYDIEEMETVMRQLRPLYTQLHSFIRSQLFKKYGELVIKPNGPIPDHLFQQVLAQAWTNGSVIDEMFPHRNLPPYDEFLTEKDYDAKKMFETANEFYTSLGFTPVPDSYWTDRLQLDKKEDEGDCKAAVYDLTPNVRMNYCHKMDFRKFLQAHGYMGRVYYALEKKDLPFYYFKSYDLEYPVGEAVLLSASTPKHLKAIGLAKNFRFSDDVLMNRHLRMGIHTLLNIPTFFVHTKVMFDILQDTVDIEGLNKHYWKLMEEFAGVEPATDRPDSYLDFPFKFYVDLDQNTQAKKFVSEILGYQFYRKFCQISGEYPGTPLHNCDFYGSTEVGDALKQMMQLGSSKPWRVVLAKLLPGDAKLNAGALLEYYQPIKDWLQTQNRAAKLKIGWNPSRRKVA